MLVLRSTTLIAMLAFMPLTAHAFLNSFVAHPSLQDLAKAQTSVKLDIRFDIGKKPRSRHAEMPPHLFLDGLCLELCQQKAETSMALPGITGAHPQISSGARVIQVAQEPSFISMKGKETVKMEQGGWEMVWRDTARCGTLCCGVNVVNGATRDNGATLPAGRLYMSFPIWTPELLAKHQIQKQDVERRAAEFTLEKNQKLQAMQETSNLFTKAMLYRDAAAAHEKHDLTGVHSYQNIPSGDQVIQIQDGLLMGLQGTIWKKNADMFGGTPEVLGEAVVRPPKVDHNTMLP